MASLPRTRTRWLDVHAFVERSKVRPWAGYKAWQQEFSRHSQSCGGAPVQSVDHLAVGHPNR